MTMLKHFASNPGRRRDGTGRFLLIVTEFACLLGAVTQSIAEESPSEAPAQSAQTRKDAARSGQLGGVDLEEVIVTANRVSAQSLQEIPMAISSLSADDLNSKGLVTMQDYLRNVPGVSLDGNDSGLNRILMRGMVTTGLDYTAVQDRSLVAVYLDDIPITLNTANPDLRVVDLERVEVIRGPQGTLYGAGSMAGTVRYVTRKPDARTLSGLVEAQSSATTRGGVNWNVRGSANVPLVTDRLGLRVGVFQEDQEGYIDNVGTGQKDANSTSNTQASAALRWLPNDALTVDATIIYQTLDTQGSNGVYRQLGNRFTSLTPVGFDDDLKVYNLTVAYDLGPAELISSTSYLDREFQFRTSFDFFIESSLGAPFPAPSVQLNSIDNFTQELRAVFGEGRLRWQVGAFYGRDKRHYTQHTFAFGMDDALGIDSRDLFAPARDEIYFGDIPTEDKQQALFGEGTFDVTDKFAVTAGLRYFDFEGPASFFQGGLAGTDAEGLPVAGEATEKADGFNPKLNLNYKISDDFMVFAEAARGFRYGGVNYPVPLSFCAEELAQGGLSSAPLTFGPDHVWSYSLGEKWTSSDRRALVNATAFYIKWSDAQTIHPLQQCGYSFFENGGKLTSTGVELETQYRLTPDFVIAVNAAYTDATSDGGIATIDARDGDRVPFFPEWAASAAAEYTLAVSSGEITFSAEYSYRGRMGTDFNPTLPDYRSIPSSSVVNASANFIAGAWQLGIFATNLTDSEQISQVDAADAATAEPGDLLYVGRPRTLGLRLQRQF